MGKPNSPSGATLAYRSNRLVRGKGSESILIGNAFSLLFFVHQIKMAIFVTENCKKCRCTTILVFLASLKKK